jgi:hypothetical protein
MPRPAIAALLIVSCGLALAASCGSDERNGTTSNGVGANGSGGAGATGGAGASGGGGASGGAGGNGGSGASMPVTECFDWPASGGAGGAGGNGGAGGGAPPPCPEGTEAYPYLETEVGCGALACLGFDAGQCCYEITPHENFPNCFPSFDDCP